MIKNHIYPNDRLFIRIPAITDGLVNLNLETETHLHISIVDDRLVDAFLYPEKLLYGAEDILYYKIRKELLKNSDKLSPSTKLDVNFKCDFEFSIVIENKGKEIIPFLFNIERVRYIPATIERTPLRFSDLPF